MINSVLPPELRDENRLFDKKSLDALLAEVARRYPDRYAEVVQHISNAGRNAAYRQGETLTLHDMFPVIDKEAMLAKMDEELAAVEASDLNDHQKQDKKFGIWSKFATSLEKATTQAALTSGNNLGGSVISGARGSPFQLKAMLTTPALYLDYKDQPIPLFVRNGFNEGLRPFEYLASTFGVRKGVISTKNATAASGDLAKQLVQASAPIIVTEEDCGSTNGIDFDPDDPDIEGRVLAKSYGGSLKAGTVIDREARREIQRTIKGRVIARSPMTCQARRGICAHCLGTLPNGHFAPKGYAAGITAAQAISEPLTQGALNTKHGGGGFTGEKKTFSGFDIIDQLVQSPETFPFRASVANEDGVVGKIEDAPQGGKIIHVNGKEHYALPGFDVLVKSGDSVEAGDQLSEGVVDVYDVLRTRGLGEARRYYVDRLKQAFEESGAGRPSKSNLETVARATLDHVTIDDPDGLGDFLPDDIASYNRLVTTYSPPKDTKLSKVEQSIGKYLQAPVLHYTIGTKLTPRMGQRLRDAGISSVPITDKAPGFTPTMFRLRTASQSGDDWLAKMHTSYLTSNLAHDAARGEDTDIRKNVHFAPRLMVGEGFGKKVEQTGEF